MKKISLSILITIACMISLFAFSACDENHSCDYIYRIPSRTFLAGEASCTSGSTYYMVCRCGRMSTETFASDDPLPHEFVYEKSNASYLKQQATCHNPAVYYKSCECGEKGKETFTVGSPLEHSFTSQVMTDKYLKTEPTYVSRGEYYYACDLCGDIGEDFYEGNYLIAEGSSGLVFELSADERYYVLTSVASVTDETLIIPVAYNGKYVNEIRISDEDSTNSTILTVVIPETITAISETSFASCERLCEVVDHSEMDLASDTTLTLTQKAGIVHNDEDSQIIHASDYAYYVDQNGEVNLVTFNKQHSWTGVIYLPNSINGQSYRICTRAVDASNVESMVLPEGSVISIASGAFYAANELENFVIPNGTVVESNFLRKESYCPATHLLVMDGEAGAEWGADWNYYADPVYYGFTGNRVSYYLYSTNGSGYTHYDTIISDYPIELPTPTNGDLTFEGWYLDELCEGEPVSTDIRYYEGDDNTAMLYAKWGEPQRDGLSMDTAIILTDNCYRDVSVQSGALYYEFTVTRSGSYSIYSTGSYDTRAWLLNSYGGEITSNDDGGSGNNFSMSATLTAGETYYVKAQQYSGGYASFRLYVIPQTTTANLGFTLSSDNTYYILTSVANVTDAEIIIPAVYQGKPVKEIGIPANDTENLTVQTVVIPMSVESISNDSFSSCPRLVEIINRSELNLSSNDGRMMTSRAIAIHSEASSRIVRSYYDPNRYNVTYDYIVDDDGEPHLLKIGGDLYTTPNDVVLPTTINASYYHVAPYSVNAQLCGMEKMIVIPHGILSIAGSAIYNADSLKALVIRGAVGAMGSGILEKQISAATTDIYYNASFVTSEWNVSWNLYGDNEVDTFTADEVTYTFISEYDIDLEYITSELPIILPTPSGTSYVFEGWYDNPDFEGDPISGTYYNASGATLYAKWGELARDGSSMNSAIILTDNCYFDYASSTPLYFEFIATRSGYYSIYSTGSYDSKAYLYDASGSQLYYDDDNGENNNFSMSVSLTAGEKYYVKASRYSEGNYAEFRLYIIPQITTANLGFTLSYDGTYYILTSVANVTDEQILIPALYNGKPVKAIDISEYDAVNTLSQSVIIPLTMESISNSSFSNCPRLIEVINRSRVSLSKGDGRALTNRAVAIHSDTTSRIVRDFYVSDGDSVSYDYIIDDGNAYLVEVNSYSSTESSLTLPDQIDGKYYHILPYAVNANFSGSDHMIILPNTVLSIATSAIYNADALKSLVIRGSVPTVESAIINKSDSAIVTRIYCNDLFITDGWDEEWNIHGDTLVDEYNDYDITYTFSSEYTIDITSITSYLPITLPTPTSGSYVFDGWYTNPDFEGDPVTGTYYSTSVTTLYAKWNDVVRDGSYFDRAITVTTDASQYVSTSSGEYKYYKFTAEVSGQYRFYSQKTSGDPKIWLYTEDNWNSTGLYDDDSYGGGNFSLYVNLEAGETVYLKIGYWNGSSSTTLYFYVTQY